MPIRSLLLLSLTALSGCAGVELNQYRSERPLLMLEEYFNGELEAWGMFQKRDGTVVKRFKVKILAHWRGNQGVLDEHFSYSDGTTDRRVWRITKESEGVYTGRADDVVGEARGVVSGNALRWQYTLDLPVEGKRYQVDFDDWMYLQEEGVLLNRSVMSKFGFRLGEVILFFRKLS